MKVNYFYHVNDKGLWCLTEKESGVGIVSTEANARLIAAAPDMYQTLQHALIDMDAIYRITDLAGVHRFRLLRDEITSALAKADGTP
jgi:hypothetical protein